MWKRASMHGVRGSSSRRRNLRVWWAIKPTSREVCIPDPDPLLYPSSPAPYPLLTISRTPLVWGGLAQLEGELEAAVVQEAEGIARLAELLLGNPVHLKTALQTLQQILEAAEEELQPAGDYTPYGGEFPPL
eukprot:9456913-Pyramimonas_sp.AAC.2